MVAFLNNLGKTLPQNTAVLGAAVQSLEPAEAKAFFAQHLDTRPLLIDWHRYYQNYFQLRQPDVDLITEYRRLADAEPEEGALAYLHGRLLDDPAQARTWYERALAAKRPCAYAHYALSFDTAARGDFADALALLDRSRQAGLDTEGQSAQRINCLLAMHRFDDALREFKAHPPSSTADFDHAVEAMHLNYLAGGKLAAEQSIKASVAGLPPAVRKQSGEDFRKSLAARLAYFEGDPVTYAASFTSDAPPAGRFTAALCRSDFAAAENALTAMPVQLGSSWFILHLAAQLAHDPKAAIYWEKAVDALAREPNGHRLLAAHLRGTARLPLAELIDFPMGDDEKRIFLAALGLHDPANRAAYFARAAQFNVSREFPYHLVAAALATAQP
jgi:hypothetical protein